MTEGQAALIQELNPGHLGEEQAEQAGLLSLVIHKLKFGHMINMHITTCLAL